MALPTNLGKLKPSWVDEFRAFIMRGSDPAGNPRHPERPVGAADRPRLN
jgi:hypothetical protein